MTLSSDSLQLQPLEMQHLVSTLKWSILYHWFVNILYSATTHGLILHKVVGDCSTVIEALNRTPGDSYSGAVYWNDHHQL